MSPARARLGVDVFTGVVIVSVAIALASLTWRLQGYPGVGPAAAPVAPGNGQDTDIRPIIALAPFGTAVATSGEGGDSAIRLRAIFMAAPAEASVALIAGADGKVASYTLGQAVGGGVIEAIQPEQIVLRTSGGQRLVGFNPAGAAGGSPAQTTAAVSPPATQVAPGGVVAPPPAAGGAASVRALIPPSVQGGSATVGPAPLGRAPAPAAAGYRVGASPNPAVLAAGIRPGDVVVRVNGSAVGPGTSERDLMTGAIAAGAARLEIIRDGQRLSLTVPMR